MFTQPILCASRRIYAFFLFRSVLRRQSMHFGKNIAGSVGSYLPGMITEIFEPSRDFAYLKLPGAGVQSIIALSK